MAFARNTLTASAGDIGKGGLANSKTTANMNTGETPLVAGRFVAMTEGGVANLTAGTETVAGVVVRSVLKDDWEKGELADVMHIGTGDSIWVEIAKGETVKRGNTVHVVAVASGQKYAGQVQAQADGTNTIATSLVVISATEALAEVSRL